MGDCLRVGKLSHYVTNHPGQRVKPFGSAPDPAWGAYSAPPDPLVDKEESWLPPPQESHPAVSPTGHGTTGGSFLRLGRKKILATAELVEVVK